jgi:YVTN family beta-propeller protein
MQKMRNAGRVLAGFVLAVVAIASQAAPFAYIASSNGAVTVIDVATQGIAGTISTGGRPEGVAMSLEGGRGYIANSTSDVVHVVDMAARTVVANIAVASGPAAVVLNPSETMLYVLHPGSGSFSQLSVINTDTGGTAGTIVFAEPAERLAMSPDGTRLFIAHSATNVISVVSTASNEVVARIGTDVGPYGMVYDPVLDRLYIANSGSNSVMIINPTGFTVDASIALPGCENPRNLALNPQSTRLFVTCEDNDAVAVVDLATLAVGTASVGTRPTAIDVTPDGGSVYVANSDSGIVSILAESDIASVRGLVNVGGTLSGFGQFIGGPLDVAPSAPGVLSGLWWNPGESGWGIHLTQRADIIFAAWFTYDPLGAPHWYVASNCAIAPALPCPTCVENASCSGELFEASGSRFFGAPFNPEAVQRRRVGTVQLDFRGSGNATMSYVVGERSRAVQIERQVFQAGSTPPAIDYTDLWWKPDESGWGLGITQQFGMMFLAWFVYQDNGDAVWYVASDCAVKSDGNGCTGTLYRTTGPSGPLVSTTFDPAQVARTTVGTIDASFTDANNGVITYTVDNVQGSKAITRQLF